jgi:hypothetical protein
MNGVSPSQPSNESQVAADLTRLLAIMKGAQGRSDSLMRVWDHDITAVERALSELASCRACREKIDCLSRGEAMQQGDGP